MKGFIVLFSLFLTLNSIAADGNDISAAIEAAATEAQVEVDLNSIEAFDAKVGGHDLEVQLLAHN